VLQDPRSHHGSQRQRDHCGDHDGHRKRHGEFAEQAPNHVAHKKQRDQHRNQRHSQREDGEANLFSTLQRGLQGRIAFFKVPRDILHHHNRIVDDEAGRDGQCHQRQIVEAVAQHIHRRAGADERKRHRNARNNRRIQVAQKEEDDHHDQYDRQPQFKLHIVDRRLDWDRQVGQRRHLDALGQVGLQLRQQPLDTPYHRDGVAARLPLHIQDDRRRLVHPRGLCGVLDAVDDVGDIGQHHRRAVAKGHNHALVILTCDQLIVRVDLIVLMRPVEVALGRIHTGAADRGAQIFKVDAVRGERRRVRLDTHRRFLSTADADQAHAAEL